MKTEDVIVGMNAYLGMTKQNGVSPCSELIQAVQGKGEAKQKFYNDLIKKYRDGWKGEHAPKWYQERIEQYFMSVDGARSVFMIQSASPLVIGQGQPSVLETYLTMHRIYGVPYIPGTALKGIAAHYCHQYVGEEDEQFRVGGVYYKVLFGSEDQSGFIHYHDAFPTVDTVGSALHLDVMTPHHHGYNDSSGKIVAPRDDDSPVPIHFLTAKADFQVLISCNSVEARDKDWLNLAKDIILAAVAQEGVGGKTNVGYGRFQ